MHTDALMLLDQVLIPSAQSAALKAELTTMRAAVAMHLANARSLQATDGGSDSGGGG
jgi:hypothetical protein